jgi:nucleotide-binding universal stress UspA family protein
MPMFKTVLLPMDLSDVPGHLAVYAKAIARKFDARVHIVFVSPFFQHYAAMYVPHPSIRQIEREIADGAEKRLTEVRNGQFADIEDVVVAVLQGDPAEEIIRYAHQKKIDLIIMGTHTRKGISKVVWGSVSERVIKGVRVPVMVISPNIEGTVFQSELMDPYV